MSNFADAVDDSVYLTVKFQARRSKADQLRSINLVMLKRSEEMGQDEAESSSLG